MVDDLENSITKQWTFLSNVYLASSVNKSFLPALSGTVGCSFNNSCCCRNWRLTIALLTNNILCADECRRLILNPERRNVLDDINFFVFIEKKTAGCCFLADWTVGRLNERISRTSQRCKFNALYMCYILYWYSKYFKYKRIWNLLLGEISLVFSPFGTSPSPYIKYINSFNCVRPKHTCQRFATAKNLRR